MHDSRLERVQAPGERTLVWKSSGRIAIELINVVEAPIAPRAETAAWLELGAKSLISIHYVEEGKCALLFLDGKFRETLSPGAYALWTALTQVTFEPFDLRVQSLEIPAQEMMTSGKASIRVKVWAEFQIVDK